MPGRARQPDDPSEPPTLSAQRSDHRCLHAPVGCPVRSGGTAPWSARAGREATPAAFRFRSGDRIRRQPDSSVRRTDGTRWCTSHRRESVERPSGRPHRAESRTPQRCTPRRARRPSGTFAAGEWNPIARRHSASPPQRRSGERPARSGMGESRIARSTDVAVRVSIGVVFKGHVDKPLETLNDSESLFALRSWNLVLSRHYPAGSQ